MTNIVPLHAPRLPRADDRTRFGLARREMNRAFAAWLAVSPVPDDVQAEIDTTINTLRQLAETLR